ncbi:hypothetical protein K3727_02905 [Rhodobacteraceae bacterium M382]|nr:hypothetical protein K3727_02905 [Rhodobacteraceae bacterium M382]
MTYGTILFAPLLPWPVLIALGLLSAAAVALAAWRGLTGWALRALGAGVLLAALAGPVYQTEDRALLDDIVVMVEDQSASQTLSDRAQQTQTAADALAADIEARARTQLRRVVVKDSADDAGTTLMTTLAETLAQEPRGRIAGVVVLSDGRVHDMAQMPDLPAPLHLLQSGRATDWDRRLVVRNAPGFAIIDEAFSLTLRIEDQGNTPNPAPVAKLQMSMDGGPPQILEMPIGQDVELPVTLPHGGRNVLQFTVLPTETELTDRNNTALVQINGVRDRLRVLLVSGEPHAGGRTWRNLLKSDSSVDLVHFTILRPPEKQDGVPVDELSLIAFPTRELFLEKIDDFDLIIFDRYKRRGILPAIYLGNVAEYVEAGGAVLVAAGPDFATADSIYRSPLAPVVPARPTARVIEQRYTPQVTDLGKRHPVTADLGVSEDWGPWLRHIEVDEPVGHVVMTGVDDLPLLVLDRVGEGRVALLASDHAWLWTRGYQGGGPQLDLLRRLAHWMMKEPELEEDALWAEATGHRMRIIRRTLDDNVGPAQITRPDGEIETLDLAPTAPGHFEAPYEGSMIGLYRLDQDGQSAVIGLGPAAPREFEETIATSSMMAPAVSLHRGGAVTLEDTPRPRLRSVRLGRPAAGRGWIGLTPRNAYETRNIRQTNLLPAWLVLLLMSGFILLGWLREGRR